MTAVISTGPASQSAALIEAADRGPGLLSAHERAWLAEVRVRQIERALRQDDAPEREQQVAAVAPRLTPQLAGAGVDERIGQQPADLEPGPDTSASKARSPSKSVLGQWRAIGTQALADGAAQALQARVFAALPLRRLRLPDAGARAAHRVRPRPRLDLTGLQTTPTTRTSSWIPGRVDRRALDPGFAKLSSDTPGRPARSRVAATHEHAGVAIGRWGATRGESVARERPMPAVVESTHALAARAVADATDLDFEQALDIRADPEPSVGFAAAAGSWLKGRLEIESGVPGLAAAASFGVAMLDPPGAVVSPRRVARARLEPPQTPVMPVPGEIVSRFGERTRTIVRPEIEIAARFRQAVAAPEGGRIAFAGPFKSYGLLLIIEHGREYHTLLWGFSRLDVSAGEDVRSGQIVGVMGTERDQSRTLHVEIRRNGRPVDPLSWLAASSSKVRG